MNKTPTDLELLTYESNGEQKRVIITTPSMLEAVYYDSKLREAYETFLATEYNLEPWNFINEIDEFSRGKKEDTEYISETFRLINTYLKHNSPKEINLAGNAKVSLFDKIQLANLKETSTIWTLDISFEELFRPMRSSIFHELSVDSYPRFIDSEYYLSITHKKNEVIDLLPMRQEAKRKKSIDQGDVRHLSADYENLFISPRKNKLTSNDPINEKKKKSNDVTSPKDKQKMKNENSRDSTSSTNEPSYTPSPTHLSDHLSLSLSNDSFMFKEYTDDIDLNSTMNFDGIDEVDHNEEEMRYSLRQVVQNDIGRKVFENYMKKNSQQNFTALDYLNTHFFFQELCENTNSTDYITCAQLIGEKFIYNENFIKQLLLIELNTSYKDVSSTRVNSSIKKIDEAIRNGEIESDMFDPITECVLSFYQIIYDDFVNSGDYLEMEKRVFERERTQNLKTTTIDGPIAKYLKITEESQLVDLIRQCKNSKIGIKGYGTFLYQFKKYNRCWKGKNFGDWLKKRYKLQEKEIMEVGEQMLQECYFHHILDTKGFDLNSNIYRFSIDDDSKVLNMHRKFNGIPLSAMVVTQRLQKSLLVLHTKYITDNGVDYEKLGKSEDFKDYCNSAIELQSMKVEELKDVEKSCCFINIYNALVIHAFVVHGAFKNALERNKFFSAYKYNIGGYLYSLNDIEHGILRANSPGPGGVKKFYFSKKDKRADYAVKTKDARLHFALVCGAKSCPRIKVYNPNNYNTGLNLASASYIDQEITVNLKKNKVTLSMLFKWYYKDFGKDNREVLQFIQEHCTDKELKEGLKTILEKNTKVSIKYKAYNWAVNNSQSIF
eukprot:gene9161-1249_t